MPFCSSEMSPLLHCLFAGAGFCASRERSLSAANFAKRCPTFQKRLSSCFLRILMPGQPRRALLARCQFDVLCFGGRCNLAQSYAIRTLHNAGQHKEKRVARYPLIGGNFVVFQPLTGKRGNYPQRGDGVFFAGIILRHNVRHKAFRLAYCATVPHNNRSVLCYVLRFGEYNG